MFRKGILDYRLWLCVVVILLVGATLESMMHWAVVFYGPGKKCMAEPIKIQCL